MSKDTVFNSIPKMDYHEPTQDIDVSEFVKVVQSRRSVRVYDKTAIPEDVVNKCLDLALLAPNSSNLQMWNFYWVRSKDKKSALVEACLSQPAASTAAELIVAVARTKTWKKNAQQMLDTLQNSDTPAPKSALMYYQKLVPMVYSMGPFGLLGFIKKVIVFLVGLFKIIPREPTSLNDMKIWATKSTALACQNLMLAFRAYGYDSCPMEGMDSSRVKKILNLPRDAQVVMVISAGKRDSKGVYGPRIRFKRQNFIKEV